MKKWLDGLSINGKIILGVSFTAILYILFIMKVKAICSYNPGGDIFHFCFQIVWTKVKYSILVVLWGLVMGYLFGGQKKS